MTSRLTGPGRLRRLPGALSRRVADTVFDLQTALPHRRGPSGKSVIVHPGLRKTGTTTIQAMLRENEALLANHVAALGRFTTPSTEEMHRAGHSFAQAPGPATAREVRRAARRMARTLHHVPQRTVILTDENLAGRRLVSGGRDFFDLAAEVLPILEEELAEHAPRFVLTTRERGGWLQSCYNQDVKRHKYAGEYEAWLEENAACRDWEAGAAIVRAALHSPTFFVPMERDREGGRFLGQTLLEIAGLPDEVLARVTAGPRSNPSLDPVQIELIREINALDLPHSVTREVVDVIRRRRDLLRSAPDAVA